MRDWGRGMSRKIELKHGTKRRFKHVGTGKAGKSALSIVLAVCMMLTSIIPASASQIQETSDTETASEAVEIAEESLIIEESTSDTADYQAEEESAEEVEEESPEEPKVKTFTVTYDMSPFPIITEEVEEYGYPQNVPDTNLPKAIFMGWYSDEDYAVTPSYIQITDDITFTARFSRNIREILSFDDVNHKAYIGGFSNGMFRPFKAMSRAETAQIFYSLLLDSNFEAKEFKDVDKNRWYAEPIGVMAALGMTNGYDDGSFRPNKSITRAEFIKMAAALDEIQDGEIEFTDVAEGHWSYPYIASAVAKGWIDGYTEANGSKTFRPNNPIKREEAVTIVNRILGRYPPGDIKEKKNVKNFYDVFSTSWSYGQIVEAATEHVTENYNAEAKREEWSSYVEDVKTEKSFWLVDGNDRYYVNGSTRKFLRGTATIDDVEYLFDSATGKAFTGWKQISGWKRYYKQGRLMEDISGEGVVTGPYYIKVYKPWNYLIIYAKDGSNGYTIPVKAMITSCGVTTPTGTFYTPYRYRWLRMEGFTWAQWCTQIMGSYLFHSVPNWTHSNLDLEVDEYNHLGETRSLGCIRLKCDDAKWIYDNCQLGTQVYISATEKSGPLKKPTAPKLPSWHTWDPTDPTAHYMCEQRGCH